ncbi:MAG: hypothetical protein NTV34_08840 [Proteobacteria bacterium]|nr:hypothetical protein [Pseudomonadota bacterium]
MSDEIRKEIFSASLRHLASGSPGELGALQRSLEAIGALEQITIVRPLYQTVVISASLRKPVLLVAVGAKMRLLSSEGAVYGDAGDDFVPTGPSKPKIVLTGIFDNRSLPFHFDRSEKLITTAVERDLLLDAIALSAQLTKPPFELKSISHQGFRGFAVVLSDNTEIFLGASPFEYKLEKLLNILGKLKSQGSSASRIELDYDGKAFVKEKKL